MNLNLRLREYLEEKGIKQSFICNKAGLSADVVSRILRCERKISAEEYLLICDALEIDPRRLASAIRATA